MDETLKILMLEDSVDDAEMIRRILLKDMSCEFRTAMTKEAYLLALDQFHPDVILADNSLPQFDAKDALQIIRDRLLHISFILVTGTVSEEFAAEIIKSGADDYLLKDRISRLPAAIKASIRQKKAERDKQNALEEMRMSNERFQLLSKATKDAVWDWDLLTGQVWCNEGFFDLLGFDPKLPVPLPYEWRDHIHPADRDKLLARLRDMGSNNALYWEDELRFQTEFGNFGTMLDRAYIVKDDSGNPVRVIGVFVNVTNKIEQQKSITRAILQAQEKERNAIGRDLHDNINQILASVSLKLGYFIEEPENNFDIIQLCRQDLHKAIEEGRKLSHSMVMPRFSERSLHEEMELLIENYNYQQIAWLRSDELDEKNIPDPIKETLFRIAQEHFTNIHKHAKATSIEIQLINDLRSVRLLIKDNGIGFDLRQKRKGIGLTNIINRAESYNGIAEFTTQPGKGCTLSVNIPLTLPVSN